MDSASRIIKDWAIVTVPRVGSHYLQERIFLHTGHIVLKYHEPKLQSWGYTIEGLLDNNARFWSGLDKDKLKIITIARDPKDLLISDITMAIKQKHRNFSDISSLKVEHVQERADEYCNHYNILSDQSTIIIDYNQLISFPFEVIQHVADILDINIVTNEYQTNLKDSDKGYMVSSKNASEYNIVKETIDKVDMSNFYEAYRKLLFKSAF